MFGRTRAVTDTKWANFNAKTGLFVIDHKEQDSDNTRRLHTTTTGRSVYKEEHESVMDVMVRRIMVREQPSYDDASIMEKKVCISVRDAEGKDAVLQFSMGQFAIKALGLLRTADLTQPITLSGGSFAEGTINKNPKDGTETVREKAQTFLVGYQGGEKLVATFSDDPEFKIPKIEKIVVTNPSTGAKLSEVSDPTNQNAFTLELAAAMIKKVEAAVSGQPAPAPAVAKPAPAMPANADESLSAADVLLDDGGDADAQQFAQNAA